MESQKNKVAIISGVTGLVGGYLLNQLLKDPDYKKVIAIVRRPLETDHEKLVQKVVDFSQLPGAIEGLEADHGYCCLGTTIKTAGSKEKQYAV
ncbi:MAG: SDR family oxidoreductase, partial [Bacteroidales bacterium]